MRLTCMGISADPSVLRFPGERSAKPTLNLIRELQPDYGEVQRVAESLCRAEDIFAFDRADEAMAERIAMLPVGASTAQRERLLLTLLNEAVLTAIATCRTFTALQARAHRMGEIAMREIGLTGDGGHSLDLAVAEADETSHALVDAWEACERAFGAARAIEIARHGEAWTPEDRNDISWMLKENDANVVRSRHGFHR